MNAARFHPLDLATLYFLGYLPLVALGCPEEVVLLFAMFDAVFGMLQHCNVDVRLGPLNWIFSMAEPHRWHHSRSIAEASSNYGSNLIVWDVVFGTFFLPAAREAPPRIGIADMPGFPAGYLAHLASPFRWRRVKREASVEAERDSARDPTALGLGRGGPTMPEHVYKTIEITGSSHTSVDDAINGGIARAAKTLHNLRWFHVTEVRGNIEGNKVGFWQVTMKVGFTLDE